MKMKRTLLRKSAFFLLPFFLVAIIPVHTMVCHGMVKNCGSCCPQMTKAEESSHTQTTVQCPSCCTVDSSQGTPFVSSTFLKYYGSKKGKSILAFSPPQKSQPPNFTSEVFKKSLPETFSVPPPLFVLKQSFLI
jgi:hypothetical protein